MKWKWNKAMNGYYYTEPDKNSFYQIEVYKNGYGKWQYAAKIYYPKYDDFGYLSGAFRDSLGDAKKIIKEHYVEKLKARKKRTK